MNTYLNEFLSYFFPDLVNAPAWLQFFVGIVVFSFFFKIIFAVIGVVTNGRI